VTTRQQSERLSGLDGKQLKEDELPLTNMNFKKQNEDQDKNYILGNWKGNKGERPIAINTISYHPSLCGNSHITLVLLADYNKTV
jgi:hypothetical protein